MVDSVISVSVRLALPLISSSGWPRRSGCVGTASGVNRLWKGRPVPRGLKPAADEIRQVLDTELARDCARTTQRLDAPPNLNGLKMYLRRPLNQDVIAAAQKLMPAHADAATVKQWVDALSGHRPRSELSATTMRRWLSGPVDSSSVGLWVGGDQVAILVKELLDEPASARTRALNQNLITLARSTPEEADDDVAG